MASCVDVRFELASPLKTPNNAAPATPTAATEIPIQNGAIEFGGENNPGPVDAGAWGDGGCPSLGVVVDGVPVGVSSEGGGVGPGPGTGTGRGSGAPPPPPNFTGTI